MPLRVLLSICLFLQASVLVADDRILETPAIRVGFDAATGALTHLVHRGSGLDFIATGVARPLFSLKLTQPDANRQTNSTAADFRKIVFTRSGTTLNIEFSGHTSLPLTARVTAVAGGDGLVRMRIAVANRSPWAVACIRFPQFAATPALGGDASDDRLLLPLSHTDGALLEAPGTRTQGGQALYPQGACTQFGALYDKTAGLYVAAEDPDGHCKRWEWTTVAGKSIEFPLVHLRPETCGEDAVLPYDVALGTFQGDWRDAADIYKHWAGKQTWCARPLARRQDIPQFLKDGAILVIAGIQNEHGYNGFLGADCERLPALAADFRRRAGAAHLIFVPYGWEKHGTWAGINYLPAVPSDDAWRRANGALRAQGDRVAMLTSGFWWVVKRQADHEGPAFDDTADFDRRKAMCVGNADGSIFTIDNYDQHNRNMLWRGLSVTLCHGSATARDTLRDIFLDVARLGTPLVSFDQEIGGGQNAPCYSHDHGHPPGYGRWMWTGFRDVCADILRRGKPIQPELGLFMENCGELTIPYAATYWSRQFGEIDHGALAARGVPLFSYLYHEYVPCIGAACVQGQGQLGARPSAELRCHVLANNLTRGLIPGPFIFDVSPDATDDWHRLVSQAFFAFCKPYAQFPQYLLGGIMRRPPAVECAEEEVWFQRRDPKNRQTLTRATIKLPTVTAGSFEADDGSLGIVIVNSTAQSREATLVLPRDTAHATLFRADRSEEWRRKTLKASARITLSLEPFGTRMLVLR